MNKILGLGLIVALSFGLSSCADQSAAIKMESEKKVKSLVKGKLDSLRKEMAADCDRQMAEAVKEKAQKSANARANAMIANQAAKKPTVVATPEPKPAAPAPKTTTVNNQKQGKIGTAIKNTGEKAKKTVNEKFDAAKKKKGKLGGKIK